MRSIGFRLRILIGVALACYFLLGIGRALTTSPWNDEAWYSSPSWSLIHNGTTGTPFLETAQQFWQGINFRTYWVVPLQFFVQVPWFKLFGFSLWSARFFAMTWGLVGILSWGFIIKRITGNVAMGVWTLVLMACDYQLVSQMTLDRMDAMSLGLASLAILTYLELRQRNLLAAVLVSQTCVAACGLTHPTPGIPVLCAVLFLAIYYDRSRITWQLLLLAAIPYVIFAAGWYAYIVPYPDLFRKQFLGNVGDMDRLGGFHHPLRAILGELGRYAGMGGFAPGEASLYRIKILALIAYFIAPLTLFLTPAVRRDSAYRPLLGLWLVYVLVMTFYDNTKEVKYGVHLVPVFDGVLAVWLVWMWQQKPKQHWIAAAVGATFLAVNTGGLLFKIYKDDYHRTYLPVVEFLQAHAKRSDLILAGSEFGFGMGFDRNIVDDVNFTYASHKKPEFIVVSPNYQSFLEHNKSARPYVYAFDQQLFDEKYKKVFSQQGYDILQRRDGT